MRYDSSDRYGLLTRYLKHLKIVITLNDFCIQFKLIYILVYKVK
jgi:hypothetical protein